MEVWQEFSHDSGPQDLAPGSDPQAELSGTTEETASFQATDSRSDTPIPPNREGTLQLCQSNQARHYKSVQHPTVVNLYV